jgi:hypothetical protein
MKFSVLYEIKLKSAINDDIWGHELFIIDNDVSLSAIIRFTMYLIFCKRHTKWNNH